MPGDLDGLCPLPPVGRGGQVVEPQRRVHRWIPGNDLDGAARVRVHRADVHLVAVPAGRGRAVVADRDGQEVEHQVGVGHVVVAPDEAPGLEVVGRPGPAARKQPPGADHRPVAPLQRRGHRDRQLGRVLDVHLQVVLQVLAHPGQVGDHVDAVRGQVGGVADAGKLQQLRGVDRAAAHDDLAGAHLLHPGTPGVLDADRPGSVEENPGHQGAADHLQVGAAHHRVQVGPRRAEPPSPVDVPVERGEALLPVSVDVGGQRVARLPHRLEERTEQRAGRWPALEYQRPLPATVGVGAGQAGLHPLEVRQAVGVVPVGHARVGRPALVVERVAPLEDHPVDAGRAAEHLAAGVVDAAAVQVRLGLGLIFPVVEPAADGEGERRRHVDEHVPAVVRAACLQHKHPGGRIGGEPVRQRAAGRAAAHDHEVVVRLCHRPSPGKRPARRPERLFSLVTLPAW